jgi:hypothetical protein
LFSSYRPFLGVTGVWLAFPIADAMTFLTAVAMAVWTENYYLDLPKKKSNQKQHIYDETSVLTERASSFRNK